jgi:hypothetical protein
LVKKEENSNKPRKRLLGFISAKREEWKMKQLTKWMVAGLAAALLAACGGGGGSDSAIESDSISGVVADGYLVGAEVFCDLDGDLTWDAGEPKDVTGAGGRYTLTGEGLDACTVVAEVIAGVTVDEDNPGQAVENGYLLTAPAGRSEFLSPLTTLIRQLMANGEGLEEAETALRGALGTAENEDFFEDYIASGNEVLHGQARMMARAMGDIGESLTADEEQTFTDNAERTAAITGRVQGLLGMTPLSGMMAQMVTGRLAAEIAPAEVDSVVLDGEEIELPVFAAGNFWLAEVDDADHTLSVRLTDGTILEMPFRMMGGRGLDLGTITTGMGMTGFDGYRFGWLDEDGDGINDNCRDADGDGVCDEGTRFEGYAFRVNEGYVDADGDGVNDRFVDADGDGLNDLTGLPYGHGFGWLDEDGDGVNDRFVDTDGDGINDLSGLTYGHGFGWLDADGDGINDLYLDENGDGINDLTGLPYVAMPGWVDEDGDGVNDRFADADGDGLDDLSGLPYGHGFGWLDEDGNGVNDRFVDADGDGVNDLDERSYGYGHMGAVLDADGDGINDVTELPYGHGFGWLDADGDSVNDRFVDADGDGVNDQTGFYYGGGFRMGPGGGFGRGMF